MFRSDYI